MARNLKLTAVFLITGGLLAAQTMTEYGAAAAGAAVGGASGKAVSNGVSAIFGKMDNLTVKAASKGEDKAPAKPGETSAASPTGTNSAPIGPTPTSATASSAPVFGPAYGNDAPAPSAAPSRATPKKRVANNTHANNSHEDTSVPPPPPIAGKAPVRKAVQETVAEEAPPPAPFAPFTLADALPATPIPPPPTMTPEAFRKIAAGMTRRDVLGLGEPSLRISMFEDGHLVEMFSYRASGERFGRLRLEDGTVVTAEAK
jgi:hypothetical protein